MTGFNINRCSLEFVILFWCIFIEYSCALQYRYERYNSCGSACSINSLWSILSRIYLCHGFLTWEHSRRLNCPRSVTGPSYQFSNINNRFYNLVYERISWLPREDKVGHVLQSIKIHLILRPSPVSLRLGPTCSRGLDSLAFLDRCLAWWQLTSPCPLRLCDSKGIWSVQLPDRGPPRLCWSAPGSIPGSILMFPVFLSSIRSVIISDVVGPHLDVVLCRSHNYWTNVTGK